MSQRCLVLPGLYGLFVQALLFFCCVSVLIGKKLREGAERTWFEFGLDSSKQLVGAGWIHILNLVTATLMCRHIAVKGDECEWYWINIMVDTTLGILVEYVLVWSMARMCGYKSGEYRVNGKMRPGKYVEQLLVWLAIVTMMKATMVAFMIVFAHPLKLVAAFVLGPFLRKPWLKLLAVMITTPLIMNSVQFWVVDNFLKKKGVLRCQDSLLPAGDRELHERRLAEGYA